MDGGLRARSKVNAVEAVSEFMIVGDGEFLFDQCEMVLAEGISEAVVADFSNGD